jgi:hypothetical protein
MRLRAVLLGCILFSHFETPLANAANRWEGRYRGKLPLVRFEPVGGFAADPDAYLNATTLDYTVTKHGREYHAKERLTGEVRGATFDGVAITIFGPVVTYVDDDGATCTWT